MLNIKFFLSAGIGGMDGVSVCDCRDSVLFQIERMGMCRLQGGTEMRQCHGASVFTCTVESTAFYSMTVYKTADEHH